MIHSDEKAAIKAVANQAAGAPDELKEVIEAREDLDKVKAALEAAESNVKAAAHRLRVALWGPRAHFWRAARKVWRTSEGQEIPYGSLGDDHLRNVIAYLEGMGGLSWFVANDLDQTERGAEPPPEWEHGHPALPGLVEEAKQRGMKDVGEAWDAAIEAAVKTKADKPKKSKKVVTPWGSQTEAPPEKSE